MREQFGMSFSWSETMQNRYGISPYKIGDTLKFGEISPIVAKAAKLQEYVGTTVQVIGINTELPWMVKVSAKNGAELEINHAWLKPL